MLSHTTANLNEIGMPWVALYNRVYDITNYVISVSDNALAVAGSATEDGERMTDSNSKTR